jgi:hypothetical protein
MRKALNVVIRQLWILGTLILGSVALSSPARAQAHSPVEAYYQTAPVVDTLSVSSTAVSISTHGSIWATVRIRFGTPCYATSTVETSTDGGVRWRASGEGSPLLTQIRTTATNPSSTAFGSAGYLPPAGSVWELPLGALETRVRVRAPVDSSTSTQVQLEPGKPYSPGMPISATFYYNAATGTALDTGIIDTDGWTGFNHLFTNAASGTPAYSVNLVTPNGTNVVLATAATGTAEYGELGSPGGSIGMLTAGAVNANQATPLPRRVRYTNAAVAGSQTGLYIEAHR